MKAGYAAVLSLFNYKLVAVVKLLRLNFKKLLKVPYNALVQCLKLFSDIYIEGMWLR